MLKKKRTEVATGTVIGVGTTLKGELNVSGLLRIDGYVEGEINAEGDVIIGEQGLVKAVIKANNVTINGQVEGRVTAKGKLELSSRGKLYGDSQIGMLAVEDGAVFQGQCQMLINDENEQTSKDSSREEKSLVEQVEALMQ